MEDTVESRARLTEEWQKVLDQARAAGVPERAVLETMMQVAFRDYQTAYGDEVLGNLLREVLFRLDQPVTQHDVAEHLIIGPAGEPSG